MKLALGTVQFGLAYGITGRGAVVPEQEVREILVAAADQGVSVLDTAVAYGDIEPRLAGLCAGLPFTIVSKIPSLPPSLAEDEVAQWAVASAQRSRQRLGAALTSLMFHNAEDLTGTRGQAVWDVVYAWAQAEGIKLGASCYAPEMLLALRKNLPLDLAQLPGNALDQRVDQAIPAPLDGCEIHLRSSFLQGLLLSSVEEGRQKLPCAVEALTRWQGWCQDAQLDPLQGCLSIVKGFASVSHVVVGVDRLSQFQEIAAAWRNAKPRRAPDLQEPNLDVIDPRQWHRVQKEKTA